MSVITEQKDRSENSVKVTLSLPEELNKLIDLYSRKSFFKKTQWIKQAITEKISREEKEKNVKNQGNPND